MRLTERERERAGGEEERERERCIPKSCCVSSANEPLQQCCHAQSRAGIQTGGRFVEEQDLGIVEHLDCDRETTRLSSTQTSNQLVSDQLMFLVIQVQRDQQLLDL